MPELEKSMGNVWSLPPLISEMRSRPSREMTTGSQSRTCNEESGVLLTRLVVLKLSTHKNYLERLANTDLGLGKGLRTCISDKFLNDFEAAGLGPHFENH